MTFFNQMIADLNTFLYSYILIILLVGTGIYFTVRTKFVQIRMFPEAIRVLTEKKSDSAGVSSFQALMISTASRVGTGNIAGVATALAAGGAGAIFWMWLLAVIGSASAFIESTLAQIYKVKGEKEFRGGPAYYIQYALGKRWLGIVFSVLLIACFSFGFNALQAFNVSSAIEYYIGPEYSQTCIPAVIGAVLAICTALVIFGGVHRIGIITSGLVPVMAVLYILLGIYITAMNIQDLPAIFSLIFTEAFDIQSIAGGFAGSCVMLGIKRGLFSNEAGMGSAPNAGAAADVSHPAKQGFVQMLSVFIDTILICTTTAMMLLNYGVIDPELTGMPFVQQAIKAEVGELGIHFITISIFLFAFSSLVGNYCYAESNLKFIKDDKNLLTVFRIICVLIIFWGAQASFDTVWNLADVLMGFMAIVNIIAILLLSGVGVRTLNDYVQQKAEGKDPRFSPGKLGIKNTRCWKD
ncbi:amino acid carrier protein [Blautia sp. An249]|uniref:alanine/glycine:cation symporter family protein n=1 Tax=Blautia sp. An249 TaxID=1965603 RepID=UPI000B389EA6|nr:alanine/glycine:cation symporter family protein [Blautia sp. An249]OUO77357.1 amino acid carrier protein [Blautia sp. An249]